MPGICQTNSIPLLIDVSRYKELLFRAVHEVLQPMGIPENVLRDWLLSEAGYMLPTNCWMSSLRNPNAI